MFNMLHTPKLFFWLQPIRICKHSTPSIRAFSSVRVTSKSLGLKSCYVLGLRSNSSSSSIGKEESVQFSEVTGSLPTTLPDDLSQALLEPTLKSLGLCQNTPPGVLQSIMEQIHVGFDQPWWITIIIATACLRILIIPLVVKAQKNMIHLNNHMPEFQRRQMAASAAGMTSQERQRALDNLRNFTKQNNINPLLNYIPMIAQGAVFTSMFFALRGMAACPVPSMMNGGCAWFTDLTIQDPYFLLPVITTGSLFIHLKLGADGISVDNMQKFFRYFILALPFVTLPVMCSFPAALNLYWLTNNLISITQARFIRWDPVRTKLGIPEMIKWKPEDLPLNSFSFSLGNEKQAPTTKRNEMSFGPYLQRIQEAETEARERRQNALNEKNRK